MEINEYNKDIYVKKVLRQLLREFCLNWTDNIFHTEFHLDSAVNDCSRLKMEQIKQHIYENLYFHDNLWYVYETIKDFKDIKELLEYLSPDPYNSPEVVFLDIIRKSRKIDVKNNDIPGSYHIVYHNDGDKTHDDVAAALKQYFRSYTDLLLNIKKRPYQLKKFYDLFLAEEIQYSFARNSEVFSYLQTKKKKTADEIIMMVNKNDLQSPREVFTELIKHDYNRFYRIINDYYGSKNWSNEIKFRAHFKLYDVLFTQGNNMMSDELGKWLLQNLEHSGYGEREIAMIKRLIKGNMKGGNESEV